MSEPSALGHAHLNRTTYSPSKGNEPEKGRRVILSAISIIVIIGSLFLTSRLYPSIGYKSFYFLAPLPPAILVFMIFSAGWVPRAVERGSTLPYVAKTFPNQTVRHAHVHRSRAAPPPILHPPARSAPPPQNFHPPIRSTPPAMPPFRPPRARPY